jgi:hypothetical protein
MRSRRPGALRPRGRAPGQGLNAAFALNLSTLYDEHDSLDRFAAAVPVFRRDRVRVCDKPAAPTR